MNAEVQLQLANICIAQLLDEPSELRKHSGASREAELREEYSRERESDRAFYRDQLACMEKRHKQELEALKESYKESNAQLKRQLQIMNTRALEISNSTLGNIVSKIIAYFRREIAENWEKEIRKADYWMMDETLGMVGCIKEGAKSYLNRYFWGIKAKAMKLVWFLYENGSRRLKAIKPYLDQFIGFFTTDGYVVYKVYEKEDHPLQTRSACLTHKRKYKALSYVRSEWQAMKSILKSGVVELSNNLAEQMMCHIKMKLKNCLNIGVKDRQWTWLLCAPLLKATVQRTSFPYDISGSSWINYRIELHFCPVIAGYEVKLIFLTVDNLNHKPLISNRILTQGGNVDGYK